MYNSMRGSHGSHDPSIGRLVDGRASPASHNSLGRGLPHGPPGFGASTATPRRVNHFAQGVGFHLARRGQIGSPDVDVCFTRPRNQMASRSRMGAAPPSRPPSSPRSTSVHIMSSRDGMNRHTRVRIVVLWPSILSQSDNNVLFVPAATVVTSSGSAQFHGWGGGADKFRRPRTPLLGALLPS